MKLKVTNTKTGQVWIEENTNHSWQDLCLDIMKNRKDFKLIYCDVEGIVFFNGCWYMLDECWYMLDECWYMLDECGNWGYIPEEYKIEEI